MAASACLNKLVPRNVPYYMKISTSAALALSLYGIVCASALVAQQRVRTEAGPMAGVSESGLNVYKGVPFAAPPVGELRWRPPTHVAHWTGTRKTDAFAPACMQDRCIDAG